MDKVTFHNETYLKVDADTLVRACTRCDGEGHYMFNHIERHSICYRCDGYKADPRATVYLTYAEAEKAANRRADARAKRAARKAAKQAAEEQAAAAAVAEWMVQYPREAALLHETGAGQFVASVTEQVLINHKVPSEKQMSVLTRIVEDREAAAAKPAAEVPEGRVEITGTIISRKFVENAYGTTTKLLIEDDRGFRVYGTMPKGLNIADNKTRYSAEDIIELPGRRVTLTATLERSAKDPAFGFYARPAKARLI